ncbi:MAG: cupin domain-containing protein [Plesiomonas sp.]
MTVTDKKLTSKTSNVWTNHVSDVNAPDGFTFRSTYPTNPNGVEVMLEQWDSGVHEEPHWHPGDDMTVMVEGKMSIQYYTQGEHGLIADGEPVFLTEGETGYIKAGRIHSATYIEHCKMVYVHDGEFGYNAIEK